MKKVLRSFVVLMAVLAATTTGSLGYFTATAVTTDNLITTGTMAVNVATTAFGSGNSGYWVNVGGAQVANFPAITNALPGVPVDVYVAVANGGSAPFDYRAMVAPYDTGSCAGGWYNPNTSCAGLSASVVRVTEVQRYSGAPDDCLGDAECLDLYGWLTTANGYNMVGAGTGVLSNPSQPFGHPDGFVSDGSYTLNALNDYSIFRVRVELDGDTTGNAYQNKTFRYTLDVDAKQTNALNF